MRKFAKQKLSSMTENILYDILYVNILKRIKKYLNFEGYYLGFIWAKNAKNYRLSL